MNLEVDRLRKQFGDFTAVDDVSFSIPDGGSLAIVGESGSGKTTIARMIVGLERPTAGTITACGNDRSKPSRSSRARRRRGREVQIVFQDPYTSLDPRQSAAAAIDEVLYFLAPGKRGARVAELCELVGLDDRRAHALPGGHCPAGSGNGSRSPGRSRPNRGSSSWTSRWPHWTSPSRPRC